MVDRFVEGAEVPHDLGMGARFFQGDVRAFQGPLDGIPADAQVVAVKFARHEDLFHLFGDQLARRRNAKAAKARIAKIDPGSVTGTVAHPPEAAPAASASSAPAAFPAPLVVRAWFTVTGS